MSIRHKLEFNFVSDLEKIEHRLTIGPNAKLYRLESEPGPGFKLLVSIFRKDFVSETKGTVEVLLTGENTMNGIKEFKKVICNEPLGENTLETGTKIFQVLDLCGKYLTDAMIDRLSKTLAQRISIQNSVILYEGSLTFTKFQGIRDAVLQFISESIDQVLAVHGKNLSCNLWETILTTEGQNAIDIEEDILFTRLMEWRNANLVQNGNEFQQLVKLIRFPLMSLAKLASEVNPTGILSTVQMIHLFGFITEGSKNSKYHTEFVTHRRKHKVVNDSGSFSNALQGARKGDFIKMLPGEYTGTFEIKDKIVIQGAGITETVMKMLESQQDLPMPVFKMVGNDSKIFDLSITSLPLDNGNDSGSIGKHGLIIEGLANLIQNVAFHNCNLFLRQRYNFTTDTEFDCLNDGMVVTPMRNNHTIYLKQV